MISLKNYTCLALAGVFSAAVDAVVVGSVSARTASIPLVICIAITYHCGIVIGDKRSIRNADLMDVSRLNWMVMALTVVAAALTGVMWALSWPKLPPKVRDALITDVAKTTKALPDQWKHHVDLLRNGYGLFEELRDLYRFHSIAVSCWV